MDELVTYDLDGPIATITIDDGKVNVLSRRMVAEINAALDRAVADKAVVVLKGREGVFSAGFDLNELRAGGDVTPTLLRAGFELSLRLLSFPTPVLIACTGHAIAMGVFLLLSADYRIGTEGTFRITANEVAIGMVLPRAAIEVVNQRLTDAATTRALLLAEVFSPAEAVAAGFLDRVVPAAELEGAAKELAGLLATLNMDAHAGTKLRLREGLLTGLRSAIELDAADFRV